jgi:integrase
VSSSLTPVQVAALRALLAQHEEDRLAPNGRSTQDATGPAVSENGIGADGGASNGEAPMCKIYLFKDRGNSWRVRVVDGDTKKRKSYLFASEAEARAAMPGLQRAYRRPIGVKMPEALSAYRVHLATRGNRPGRPNRPRTVKTTMDRMMRLFDTDSLTGELTREMVNGLWAKLAEGKAVDTLLNTLAQAKTFFRWLKAKGWLKHTDALDGIEVLGRRKKGKPQLTEDESKRLLVCALGLGRAGDAGAVAAATALLLGMRTSEISERIVRDLDAGGTKLRITSAKTAAGIRTMKIPTVLQPLLQGLAKGKEPGDRLFGQVNRHWVLRAVKRICTVSGVPLVPAHGLRGTHARLAVEAGISGDVVAASLGHENFAVTAAHYAGADAVTNVAVERVADALN